MTAAGAVVIGRNEGERLCRCLQSVMPYASHVVYVDSGSTDASVAAARALGAEVVELDPARPFTAARARNTGLRRLLELNPRTEFVQFVDGDCEVRAGWWSAAAAALREDPKFAVVCGRRRERHPEASVYNRLCDIEWNTPVGEAAACGGDAMMRVAALGQVAGYREDLICGEEPEMCLRLRRLGWKVLRLDAEMTLHDADIRRFGQWWRRTVRGGWAYAEGAGLHGRSAERYRLRERRSNWVWGLFLPSAAGLLAWPTKGIALLMLLGFPALAWRIYRRSRRRGLPPADARAYALFCTIGKFPQMIGQAQYHWSRLRRRPGSLIEYK